MPDIVKWGVIQYGGIARRRTIPQGISVARNTRLAVLSSVCMAGTASLRML